MFSRPLAFSTIPKACGFEAATRFKPILMGGSLIPIVVICLRHAQGGDGDGFSPGDDSVPACDIYNSLTVWLRKKALLRR